MIIIMITATTITITIIKNNNNNDTDRRNTRFLAIASLHIELSPTRTLKRAGAGIMEAGDSQVTTIFTVQPSFHPRHSTNRVSWSFTIVGERAVTHLISLFADDSKSSWYSTCRAPMVEWWLECENCRHLTVVGLHDTSPTAPSCANHVQTHRALVASNTSNDTWYEGTGVKELKSH